MTDDLFAPIPYLLPAGNVSIAFSGGRTSAYMLRQILDANDGLPDRVVVTFQNTGREMPATLDFVHQVSTRWNVPIVWLEYRPQKPLFEIVNHNSAARDGEPFESLVRKRRFLPNVQARFCTGELKTLTAKRYLRSIGWDRWTSVVGLRADEPKRLGKPDRDRWTTWHPLAIEGVTKADVMAFWRDQPFDLELPLVDDRNWLGNCDGCFLKAEADIVRLGVEHPERAAWWERMESVVTELTNAKGKTEGRGAWFSKRYTREEMRIYTGKRGKAALSNKGELCQVSDGDCTG